MNFKHLGILIVTLFAATALSVGAEAATKKRIKAHGGPLYVGCTSYLPFCVALTTLDGKKYNVSSANPPMPAGVAVAVVGVETGNVGIGCFLPSIQVKSWFPIRSPRIHCPIHP